MQNQKLIQKYANLIVNTGANVQKGQIVEIFCSVNNAKFGRLIFEQCYLAGAKFVIMNWTDESCSVSAYKYAKTETLKEIKPYQRAQYEYIAENRAVKIVLKDDNPNALAGLDSKKIAEANKDIKKFIKTLFDPIENEYQWCIAGIPSSAWARQVFPELNEEDAINELWNLIFKICRINENDDPNKLWAEHNKKLKDRSDKLNKMQLEYMEYKNSLGTDLKVYLPKNHIWQGGQHFSKSNVAFYPNLPTEEIFSAPHSHKIDGTLVSTMPLCYNGVTINNINFEFKDGKIIKYSATTGEETLKYLIETDENSCRLGEIALVPFNNPIRKSGRLFFKTLFDENASCHFAIGDFYKTTVKDGDKMNDEELDKIGCNQSSVHVDFMVGSEDLSIIGTTKTGEKIVVFEKGNFVI